MMVESLKKYRINENSIRILEHANLVFQSVEVYSCLSSYRGVNHCQQGGGDIDEVDAPLET